MSNGVRICCLAGVCCTPEQQAREWAKLLHNAKIAVGSVAFNANRLPEPEEFGECSNDYQAEMILQGKYISSKMGVVPIETQQALLTSMLPFADSNLKAEIEKLRTENDDLKESISKSVADKDFFEDPDALPVPPGEE